MKRLGREIHYFLAHLTLRVDLIPIMEQLTLVRVNTDRMVHLVHLLFSVRDDIYSTSRCLFVCLGKLPVKVLPPLVEISHKAFLERLFVHAVPLVAHITHLGRISPPDWNMRSCKSASETAGADYLNLGCRRLTFVPPDCVAWLLEMEEDRLLNFLSASKGFFPG